ncbi:MAG: amino acid permease [Gemmatimonadales bacterium]|nr:amino acid permease [Gemmatimonadales bacterium]
MTAAPSVTYARRLGLFSATMVVIGGVIGSGIFLNPSIVAQRVGTSGLTTFAWALGGVITLLGAFCFAELGNRMPRVGGGYAYLRDAYGPLPAFLYGWALLLVISTGAIAAVAVTFASYAGPLLGLGTGATVPLAVGAIVLLSAVNYVGVRPGAVTQNVFTVLKLAALAVLIAAGLGSDIVVAPSAAAPAIAAPTGAGGTFVAVGAALVPILFAYGGWQQSNFIAEEMVDAERTLPRAILLGTAAVVTVYVLANLAYLRTLGVNGLAASAAPAAGVMAAVVGPVGAKLIAAGIAASTFGFLNLVILVTPRVYQAMAADGIFLPQLAALHPRFRTPTPAIVLQGAWAIVLTLSGTYGQLLDYVVFGDWIFFGLTASTLLVYRARERKAGATSGPGFRAPLYPLTPALFALAAIYVVASSVASNPKNAAIGAGLLLLGVPVFVYWRRASGAVSRG